MAVGFGIGRGLSFGLALDVLLLMQLFGVPEVLPLVEPIVVGGLEDTCCPICDTVLHRDPSGGIE